MHLSDAIRIRGARTHNLRNLSLDLPKHQLVVLTGLSGSGKSSLAFDTLYAEGQRRYVESLSVYARQFLQMMDKPDVDLIEGLSPAIAIEQKTTAHNPRSTVGTTTEIYDYLRLLYARIGVPHCPTHGQALQAQTVAQMVDTLLAWPEEARLVLLAPLQARDDRQLDQLLRQGFLRLRINQHMVDIHSLASLPTEGDVAVVVDRLKVKASHRRRLADSLEMALQLGEGYAQALCVDEQGNPLESLSLSNQFACPICRFHLPTLTPRHFSFNSPLGACTHCNGMGVADCFDPQKVVRHPELSLMAGALAPWDERNSTHRELLLALGQHYQFSVFQPFETLPTSLQHLLLHGPDTPLTLLGKPFEGAIKALENTWQRSQSPGVKETLTQFRSELPCPHCEGDCLRPEMRHVTLGQPGMSLPALQRLSLFHLQQWFQSLTLSDTAHNVAKQLIQEINTRLHFLVNVGLGYLSLHRRSDTLSGGEFQRIRLASQVGSGLTGVMYVLDEPSIGLHQRDNQRLIQTLRHLQGMGNSVIVVEHDEDMIREADWVVDMGTGAGVHGGQVVAQGTAQQLMQQTQSITGQYLSGAKRLTRPSPSRAVNDHTPWLALRGCHGHNLKNVDLLLPLGRLVCITGVSGSGKSTLINDTLSALLRKRFHRAHDTPQPYEQIEGVEALDNIITIDQSPIGRTPRSNPATYTGLLTGIRDLFANTPEARVRGYGPGRFSFNVKGGRCEMCEGDGLIKVEMHFLPDVYVPCESCQGKRYNRETLEIEYKGLNISEVLELTIEQALTHFHAVPTLVKKLQTLIDVGLGYLKLGQSATTLSGGEAQRLKLALELSRRQTGRTLYILDEPTTGLHFADIQLLMTMLDRLVQAGNSVVVIEHNIDVIAMADWVVDMGPEGGQAGGNIVATGTPAQIAEHPDSVTGPFLKRHLKQRTSP